MSDGMVCNLKHFFMVYFLFIRLPSIHHILRFPHIFDYTVHGVSAFIMVPLRPDIFFVMLCWISDIFWPLMKWMVRTHPGFIFFRFTSQTLGQSCPSVCEVTLKNTQSKESASTDALLDDNMMFSVWTRTLWLSPSSRPSWLSMSSSSSSVSARTCTMPRKEPLSIWLITVPTTSRCMWLHLRQDSDKAQERQEK